MSSGKQENETYSGFEQGPIRPPSEAHSLLIRVTRNCPWNRCTFCPVYKGTTFSRRPVDHVKRDIDAVHAQIEKLRAIGGLTRDAIRVARDAGEREESPAFDAAVSWCVGGMRNVFLQDANSLLIKPVDLVEILVHLRKRFPEIQRVTSYARSQTIAAMEEDELRAIAAAGLNRIHIGLESGSDKVLELVKKGVTKAEHVAAGRKVKDAGIELSEYVMPGLGGQALSHEHALETADALNQIDPHFIRLRTLAIPTQVPLYQEYVAGRFEKCTEVMVAREILMFLEHLDGIASVVKSDHVLNLFGGLEGTLPEDKPQMTAMLREFLDLAPELQMLFQVGRRFGILQGVRDLEDPRRRSAAEAACIQFGITPYNVDAAIDEIMRTFI